VSTGLALTAQAVKKRQRKLTRGGFQFNTMKDLQNVCPSIKLYDGDGVNAGSSDGGVVHVGTDSVVGNVVV